MSTNILSSNNYITLNNFIKKNSKNFVLVAFVNKTSDKYITIKETLKFLANRYNDSFFIIVDTLKMLNESVNDISKHKNDDCYIKISSDLVDNNTFNIYLNQKEISFTTNYKKISFMFIELYENYQSHKEIVKEKMKLNMTKKIVNNIDFKNDEIDIIDREKMKIDIKNLKRLNLKLKKDMVTLIKEIDKIIK